MKRNIFILVAVTFFILAVIILIRENNKSLSDILVNKSQEKSIVKENQNSTTKLEFQDYVNTSYGYSISFPKKLVKIDTSNVYGKNITEESDVSFSIYGEVDLLRVDVLEVSSVKNNLQDYANNFYRLQTDFKDSHSDRIPKIEISELEKEIYINKTFFTYVANDGVKFFSGSRATGNGDKYKYYIGSLADGRKILLSYLISSEKNSSRVNLAKSMFDSFRFTE